MGNVEQHLENATPTTLLHYQLSDMWRSPRGTVLRIEGLALVAIACSFFLVAFGSCRRWSNRWIIQKGFLAAQVLSLSLGTYSIGLMQSSSVKSEMYPIWAVSLLTLFGCIDPVTTYIGLEYKGPLLKMIFQLGLYCGYVVLMSVSAISGGVGKLAIGMLSAITFMKGFHMSLALVLPSRTQDQLAEFNYNKEPIAGTGLQVHLPVLQIMIDGDSSIERFLTLTDMSSIHRGCNEMVRKLQLKEVTVNGIEDVCLGYSLSHLLQRRFLRLDTAIEWELRTKELDKFAQSVGAIGYKRTLKAIEVELAFLYEVFFTSNGFLHYHQAKTSSFWAFASFIGICFVGVATVIPGAMSSLHRITGSNNSPGAGTIVVNTTRADLIITLVILVSLALLQLVQLIRCWTSNWARVAFACGYTRRCEPISWGVRLRAFVVTRMNWFDKYLWQDKLGQYSLVDEAASSRQKFRRECRQRLCHLWPGCLADKQFPPMLVLQYIGQLLRDLLAPDTSSAVGLHDDVKAPITDFLGKIESRRIGVEWSSLFVDNGIDLACLPYSTVPLRMYLDTTTMSDACAFSHRVMIWHVATRYCELADPQEGSAGGGGVGTREKNRRVAMALSRYCAYLVVSAPELLPGPSTETKRAHRAAAKAAAAAGLYRYRGRSKMLLEAMKRASSSCDPPDDNDAFETGVYWGMWLLNETTPPPGCSPRRHSSDDRWELLALLWVQTLLYAAPYGDVQRHMQRLSQGGEFITHLWALLYHMGIDGWDREPAQAAAWETRGAQAAAGETREAAQVQGDAKDREPEAAAAETTHKMEAAQAAGETREAAQVQGDAREAEI